MNSFVTLTYGEPMFDLRYADFQLFMKRLRRTARKCRFFMSGEYGGLNGRAHFHALLFGVGFPDKEYLRKSPAGERLYRSAELEKLWPHGFSSIGSVSFKTARYVAKYVLSNLRGRGAGPREPVIDADGVLSSRTREFGRMSLRPGIGSEWYRRFSSDCYPSGQVVVDGRLGKTPLYYDRKYRKGNAGAAMLLSLKRREEGQLHFSDTVPGRLEACEAVAVAQGNLSKRSL